ncbi:alpha/beta hydrolase [Catenisphaera adipataccumulans]|jgi:predicted alpha/beta superfamily hydrolase|uniref:Alpha/beta hydrolase n=1 Tax=Catenisphaera adipataccumulans TaxID=700500 RepID=A0A7W8FXY3_9FIRM|nr:alpha/beta hydrolase-fold protein [Catenisphaera adipataccumulans]MBB5183442.1 hypothetical protein [Catenisphaera adipataccumulans]
MAEKNKLMINGQSVTIYPCAQADRPVIYLNEFQGDGQGVYERLKKDGDLPCSLIVICSDDWNRDMSPWEIPPVMKNDAPYTGGADAYIRFLFDQVMQAAEQYVPGHACWRGLAGYSLAGLFAVYSLYRVDVFDRIASVSGSLWYPGFQEYVQTHDRKGEPEAVYFSLGDTEKKTRNPYMKTVQDCTQAIYEEFKKQKIHTTFELNPGNHFQDPDGRLVKGIQWLLTGH